MKTTFVHTADLHLNSAYPNCYKEGEFSFRTYDVFDRFKKVTKFVIKNDPDWFFISGDIFDSSNVKKEIVIWFIREISKVINKTDNVKIAIITGQHDLANDGTTVLTLSGETHKVLSQNKRVFFSETAEIGRIVQPGAIVYLVPFSNNITEQLKLANADVKKMDDGQHYNILVTHLPFSGSVLGNGYTLENQNKINIVNNFDYVAAGDIHKHQVKGVVHYPGSLVRLNYGEKNDDKGFLVGEITDEGLETEFISLPDRKYLELKVRDLKYFNTAMRKNLADSVKDNIVKMKFWIGGDLTLEMASALEQKLLTKDEAKNVVLEIKYSEIEESGDEKIGFGLSFDDALENLLDNEKLKKREGFVEGVMKLISKLKKEKK